MPPADLSHLTRGAWIEMKILSNVISTQVSHLTRGAWIEIDREQVLNGPYEVSHLTRGAWIEISLVTFLPQSIIVAPHTRCVD